MNGYHAIVTFAGTLALDSDDKGMTLNGSGVYTAAGATALDYASANVHHTFGSCYASSATMSSSTTVVGKSGKAYTTTEAITFSYSTPTTGEATANVGSTTTTV